MKHGDKGKSKAAGKASGKKGSKASTKGSKVAQAAKAKTAGKSQKAVAKAGGNGKTRGRSAPEDATFTNPVVAAAFKRAVRKYPNAFRKLTD